MVVVKDKARSVYTCCSKERLIFLNLKKHKKKKKKDIDKTRRGFGIVI